MSEEMIEKVALQLQLVITSAYLMCKDGRGNEAARMLAERAVSAYNPNERLREAAWQPMSKVPKHGKRIYALKRGGEAWIVYANPELDRSLYLAWWPLPDRDSETVAALSPLPQGEDT